MSVSLIAALDEQRGIAKNGHLLCHLPADLQHFKALTLEKPIVMGRKTFDSIGRVLPQRLNVIVSRKNIEITGAKVVKSLDEALMIVAPEIMVIGGAEIYQQALSRATCLYLTLIHHAFDADLFFPKFDEKIWICVEQVKRLKDEKNPYDMTFCRFQRMDNQLIANTFDTHEYDL